MQNKRNQDLVETCQIPTGVYQCHHNFDKMKKKSKGVAKLKYQYDLYLYIYAFLLCFFCDIFDKQNVNDLPESLHFFQANNETKNTEKKINMMKYLN